MLQRRVAIVWLAVCMMAILSFAVMGDALSSTHYNFNETSLGGIGNLQSQSTHFKSQTSGGILGINDAAGAIMRFDNGHETTNDPGLAFAVIGLGVNLGSFSPTQAAVTTSQFEVANYTSYGYIIQIYGTPPTSQGHTIAAMPVEGPSAVGTEQFGINLVANTSPASVGANPDQGLFGAGTAYAHYNTPDNYRFVSGDIIASAPKTSGTTIYTISYLVNVTSLTYGGQYTSDQTIICTATF